MKKSYQTEQEDFWAGKFGDNYIERNCTEEIIASNTSLFAKVLSRTGRLNSMIEFGANIGMNLRAIRRLDSKIEITAVEINKNAAEALGEIEGVSVCNQSIIEFQHDEVFDLSLIKGVLIHINPEFLPAVYETLYKRSSRYICLCEYYNPVPVELDYHGHESKLFKRDFAGELMDLYKDLELIDYGFMYRRDPMFLGADLNWFLLEKSNS